MTTFAAPPDAARRLAELDAERAMLVAAAAAAD
jgi:hypothetical protein